MHIEIVQSSTHLGSLIVIKVQHHFLGGFPPVFKAMRENAGLGSVLLRDGVLPDAVLVVSEALRAASRHSLVLTLVDLDLLLENSFIEKFY